MQVHLHHPDASPPGDIAPLLAGQPPDATDGFVAMLQRVTRDSITPASIQPSDGSAEGDMPASEDARDGEGPPPGAEGALADRPGPGTVALPDDAALPREDSSARAGPRDADPVAGGPQLLGPGAVCAVEEGMEPVSRVAGMAGPAATGLPVSGLALRENALPLRPLSPPPPPSPPAPSPDVAADSGRIVPEPDGPEPNGGGPPRGAERQLPAGSREVPAPDRTQDQTAPVQPAVSAAGADDGSSHDSRPAGRGPVILQPAARMTQMTQMAMSGDVRTADHPATGDAERSRLSASPAGTSQGAHVAQSGAGRAGAGAGSAPATEPPSSGEPAPLLPHAALPNTALPTPGRDATSPAPSRMPLDGADGAGPALDARGGMDDGSRRTAILPGEVTVAESITPDAAAGQEGRPVATAAAPPSLSVTTMPAAPPLALLQSDGPPPLREDAAPDAASVSRQVALAVRSHAPGVTEIRLDPPELGALRLDLRTNGTVASLVIGAERPEAMDLVRSGLHGLTGELRALGFERVEITLDHNLRDNGSRIDPGGDGRADADAQHAPDGATRATTAPDPAPPDPAPALSAAPRAPAGATLDIRL